MGELELLEIITLKHTRHYVIELSVLIEELMSETLGKLLDIEWKTSQSLGMTSKAISFSQKVSFIQDIKRLQKVDRDKLETFMQVRNKFAHVKTINSFENLFSNKSELKKNLYIRNYS